MLRELKLKPDFSRTIDRFEAWWNGELIDRPPVTVRVTSATREQHSASGRSLDAQELVDRAVARIEQQVFAGDAFPSIVPDLGPQVPDPDSQVWRLLDHMTQYALEIADGRYVVGIANMYSAFDSLAALRTPQQLCVDMLDNPAEVAIAAREMAHAFAECFTSLHQHISAAGMGCTTWVPFHHQGPACVLSCDVWGLLSDRQARQLILPAITVESQPLQRALFHLDGPQALRHLDLVLSIPKVAAVQWAYGTGHGRAIQWLDVYRRILAHGCGVHVLAADPDDALDVLEALGPVGLWIEVQREFDSPRGAGDFLRAIERSSRRHTRSEKLV